MTRILVTGATGQIGSELVPVLREKYGNDNVIAAGHKKIPDSSLANSGPYTTLDVTSQIEIEEAVLQYRVDTVYHLAALLSAVAEENPQKAWEINMGGLYNILEACRRNHCALFFPSSIGAFGSSSPKDNTPQDTIQRPATIYGICKVSGELLCDYYFTRYGVDTRGVRFPGLISFKAPPGGGTTDYAVDIFYQAIKKNTYECFLRSDTRLDMMYMPDALRAAVEIMQADPEKLTHRNAFNIASMSFTPEELAGEIRTALPGFSITYKIDPLRQAIADSWPHNMDDSAARNEWGWKPQYTIASMVNDMIYNIKNKEL